MSATIEQMTHEALTLPESERARLAHTLLCSLDPDEDAAGIAEDWEAEIARRVARVKQGTAKGRPAEDVFRDLQARYS